ncbi:MAG: peptidylprolyl isomerase [Brevundimonas sp.]|uniref:peptidylprolyl isomerase n=1 Tax=Brevundimonas sp. TaxID=1871086 RepID=UPI002734D35B|nr:peptidylprolyl isomerase [Brevundimonas sp.]MDP3377375.1 peptidylprolyl isomerase [Brevundimonas sp.]
MITLAAAALAGCATEATVPGDPVRVDLVTERGTISLELATDAAPLTVCNFLSYVTDGNYEGGSFFRTVVAETNANPNPISVIQGATPRGADDDLNPPIPLERTRDTGLSHLAGTISMARDGPDTATSSFFIVVEDAPALDYGGARNPDGQGFAAFGRVTEGMDINHQIHRSPADAEEQLTPPVRILAATVVGEVPAPCHP